MSASKAAQKRARRDSGLLTREYKTIAENPPPYIEAHPSESNILEWHYIITGPEDTPYHGGQYWGTLMFPPTYPFAPPAIRMHTPSGRFQPSTRLCLSISDFHPKSFNPAWEVSTILIGLLSFMTSEEMTTGSASSHAFPASLSASPPLLNMTSASGAGKPGKKASAARPLSGLALKPAIPYVYLNRRNNSTAKQTSAAQPSTTPNGSSLKIQHNAEAATPDTVVTVLDTKEDAAAEASSTAASNVDEEQSATSTTQPELTPSASTSTDLATESTPAVEQPDAEPMPVESQSAEELDQSSYNQPRPSPRHFSHESRHTATTPAEPLGEPVNDTAPAPAAAAAVAPAPAPAAVPHQTVISPTPYSMPPAFQPTPRALGLGTNGDMRPLPRHGLNGPAHMHHPHPSNGSLQFGHLDSNNSSPAPPHSAGFAPPPGLGGLPNGQRPFPGHGHTASGHGYPPQMPYGTEFVPVTSGDSFGRSSVAPAGMEHYPHQINNYGPSTPHSFQDSHSSHHADEAAAFNQRHGHGGPNGVVANHDDRRHHHHQQHQQHQHQHSAYGPAHQRMMSNHMPPPHMMQQQMQEAQNSVEGLFGYLQSQFTDLTFVDCTLELRYLDDRAPPVRIPGHRLVFARSQPLRNLLQTTSHSDSHSRGMDAQTILLKTDDKYINSSTFWMAIQRLYSFPLLSGPPEGASMGDGNLTLAGNADTRFGFALGYAAAGKLLNWDPIIQRGMQLCLWRGWQRLIGDPSITVGSLIGNTVMALIIGSVFYNLQDTSASFFQRGALLFFALLMNAFASALEILTLYAQRPIVEKHSRYALYHPSAEAVASMLVDMPYKLLNCLVFNITLYFITNLRREAGAFFFFLLISFFTVLAMSMIFRTIASSSRTLSQAMVPAAILILILVIFTGFVIPTPYMLDWCRWLNYVDPLAYAFEALVVNEFHNRNFICTNYVPSTDPAAGYESVSNDNRVCTAVGSIPGNDFTVAAAALLALSALPSALAQGYSIDSDDAIRETARTLAYDMMLFYEGNKTGMIPGILPGPPADGKGDYYWWQGGAMMGTYVDYWHLTGDTSYNDVVREGMVHQTTLLDCLADRTSMGVIIGEMLVDGYQRDTSFQRKTGYVQQQDLHLETTTVREALNFSALLRQPAHVPKAEKLAYVDEVIKLLDMEEYAEAVVGVPGEGLNVEQRKRLTIGVELAAKPPLLLFVDEPTSGLDSQTSWAILDLLEKLTKSGQAILCTIHQPSAMLGVAYEIPCERDPGRCSADMLTFKGYMHRWLAVVTQLVPSTASKILPVLQNSTQAAIRQCTGGASGRVCGFYWDRGEFIDPAVDKTTGAGEQMNVLAAVSSLLIAGANPPTTNDTGGTSRGDSNAGRDSNPFQDPEPITTADRAGAGIVTFIILASGLSSWYWMSFWD
ncbi:hypothetical protein BN1723_003728 [Verticillium longisporum]|uniref:UBC core domain-containing protein n=1 Tax=Verticillium longisporum TaxID=100787 RepID=A0A0G4MAK2_VERLO|nr:hypothetical protein BN1723_003728 [Verticillium longisporum]